MKKENNINPAVNKLASAPQMAGKIAIIQANWHSEIVTQATISFIDDLSTSGMSRDSFDVFDVAGSLEIPLQAKKLAATGRYNLIMATGLIVDGGIYRHDFVAATVLDAMMQVQLETGIPILSVVLTPHQFQESAAHITFFKDHFVIKGHEAAQAARMTLANMAEFTRLKLAS